MLFAPIPVSSSRWSALGQMTWLLSYVVPLLTAWSHSLSRLPDWRGGLLLLEAAWWSTLGPTKTCAVLTFKGRGAPAARIEHLVEAGGCAVSDELFGDFWLPFAASYKHLGSAFATEGDLSQEIAQRIGTASSALVSLRRSLVGNRKLARSTRCSLVEALICSRLLFGAGSWHALPTRLLQRLQSFLTKVLREAVDEQFWRAGDGRTIRSDGQLYGDFLLQTVRMRLCYAASVFSVGSPALIQALQAEKTHCADSWLSALDADLACCA